MFAQPYVAPPALHSFASRPEGRPKLEELAEQRLRCNSYLALKNVTCEVQDGTLFLRGELPSYYLKQIASTVVADLDGIERIVNLIEVGAPRQRSTTHPVSRSLL